MNFEDICDLCKNSTATIEYHIEKPIIAEGFEYGMEEHFDNEVLITFPTDTNEVIEFIDYLTEYYGNDKECDWIEHYGDELMKEYDTLHIWWNEV